MTDWKWVGPVPGPGCLYPVATWCGWRRNLTLCLFTVPILLNTVCGVHVCAYVLAHVCVHVCVCVYAHCNASLLMCTCGGLWCAACSVRCGVWCVVSCISCVPLMCVCSISTSLQLLSSVTWPHALHTTHFQQKENPACDSHTN